MTKFAPSAAPHVRDALGRVGPVPNANSSSFEKPSASGALAPEALSPESRNPEAYIA